MTTKIFCVALATLGFLCDKKDESAAPDAAAEAAAAPVQTAATTDTDAAAATSATATATHHAVVPTKPSATATAATGNVNISCPTSTQVAFAGQGGVKVCHVGCNTNTDCSKNAPGTKCTGSGQILAADGSHNNSMKFCQ